MKSGFSKLSEKNEFLAIRTFTYGFVRVFCKIFFKKGVSHYTQKNIAFWGVLSEKTSKIFIPPVIRRFERKIGGVFFKSFSKILSSSLYAEKSSLLGPLPCKKIHPFTIRKFQRRFRPLVCKKYPFHLYGEKEGIL